jgi:DeoR family transcriptional regulator of aga operon
VNREERLSWLLETLAHTGRIDVETIAREGGVSSATIRRDLDHLEQQQMLTRTHGGAIANSVAYDLPLRYKAARHATEKQRIGSAAAALVSQGTVIGLNGGTTTTEVARAIANRMKADTSDDPRSRGITVVTNAVNIANELTVRPNIKIIVTGGAARAQSYELVGSLASLILNKLTLDIVFLGVDSLDVRHGASAQDEDEANVNYLMASRAHQVVVVADSTKLARRAFAHICDTKDIHMLITDRGASESVVETFVEQGIHVKRV